MLEDLARLVDLLQAHGVRRYSGPVTGMTSSPRVELELVPPPDLAKPTAAEPDPDTCRCGHGEHAHMNGLCIHGCDVEKCAPPEETKQ